MGIGPAQVGDEMVVPPIERAGLHRGDEIDACRFDFMLQMLQSALCAGGPVRILNRRVGEFVWAIHMCMAIDHHRRGLLGFGLDPAVLESDRTEAQGG